MNFGTIKPSFLIIGVQKGGTSSLHNFLIQHPKLIAPKIKELHYFDTLEPTPPRPYLDYFPREYFTSKISFEATPRYISYPGTAKKIFDFNPKMKFIVLLRDPAKRAYSAWNMYKQMENEKGRLMKFNNIEIKSPREKLYSLLYKNGFPTFEEWVNTELSENFNMNIIEPSIIRRGYYKEQIENYLGYFKREQFLFLNSNTLKTDTENCLSTIAYFLKISEFPNHQMNLSKKNKREYEEDLDDVLYLKLMNHYRLKNEGLEKLTGLELKWMNSQ